MVCGRNAITEMLALLVDHREVESWRAVSHERLIGDWWKGLGVLNGSESLCH